MVSYVKGRMQAKGILKKDPVANIWALRHKYFFLCSLNPVLNFVCSSYVKFPTVDELQFLYSFRVIHVKMFNIVI